MPRIIYDHTHPDLMKHLNDRGFLNYSYCKENIPGMDHMRRNAFLKIMKRFENKYCLKFNTKIVAIPTTRGNHPQKIYYIEGGDIESLIKASIGLDWLTEKVKCMNHMAEHYRRNYLGTEKRVSEVAEECRIQNYTIPMKIPDRNSEKQEWMQVTRLHYVGTGQHQALWGER